MPAAERNNDVIPISKAIDDLEQTTNDVLSWQSDLRASMFDAIKGADVVEIVKKQVELAKAGNVKSAQFVLAQVLGTSNPVKIHQTNIVTDVETAARIANEKRRGK